ncbi:MFS transporter [Amycolatopsis sp. FDAARGOS 1241]|uniref:MFS transporter n=1 Tax=Amycolatopsis sp. FDAARGOS 1241 TaxID=2778070 RepID=UPI001950912C|nr:MFS transporter [Amycolatopsis sp. FDAARGOS 1241]QRP47096.1 MFS transporter [Amycolatopsis sp. FDAARGOS 1241]
MRFRALVLSFLAVLVDGFDTAALSFSLPSLAHEWHATAAAFTLAIVATNAGTVVGYLAAGRLCARFGRRCVLLTGVGLFAAGTVLTAVVLPSHSLALLAVMRLVSGLGLGAVLPAAVSFAVEHFSPAYRSRVSVAVTLGLAAGATLGGFFGGKLITVLGPTGVFWLAGAATVVVFAAMLVGLPPAVTVAVSPRGASVLRLFGSELRTNTGLLWAYSFLVFASSYTLISWAPTLLTSYGFTRTQAPLGLAFVSLGGIIGGLVLIPVAARIGIMRALVVLPALGVVFMLVAGAAHLSGVLLLLVLTVAGVGIIAGHIGQTALAVALYDAGARTTGVGWSAALGRLGSVAGPAGAGLLLALTVPSGTILLIATIPALVAIGCALALWRRDRAARITTSPAAGVVVGDTPPA